MASFGQQGPPTWTWGGGAPVTPNQGPWRATDCGLISSDKTGLGGETRLAVPACRQAVCETLQLGPSMLVGTPGGPECRRGQRPLARSHTAGSVLYSDGCASRKCRWGPLEPQSSSLCILRRQQLGDSMNLEGKPRCIQRPLPRVLSQGYPFTLTSRAIPTVLPHRELHFKTVFIRLYEYICLGHCMGKHQHKRLLKTGRILGSKVTLLIS